MRIELVRAEAVHTPGHDGALASVHFEEERSIIPHVGLAQSCEKRAGHLDCGELSGCTWYTEVVVLSNHLTSLVMIDGRKSFFLVLTGGMVDEVQSTEESLADF